MQFCIVSLIRLGTQKRFSFCFWIILSFTYLFVCKWECVEEGCTCHNMYVRSDDSLRESVLFFHRVSLGVGSQVVRLGDKLLCLMYHLISLRCFIFFLKCILIHVCLCVPLFTLTMCIRGISKAIQIFGSPRSGVAGSCEVPIGCQKWSAGLLQKQQGLLTL